VVSEATTAAGRALLGLDMTAPAGYWSNVSSGEMRTAILAIEREAQQVEAAKWRKAPATQPEPCRHDEWREGVYNIALAARFGGEAMDAKQRGGREKLAYIEREARALLVATEGQQT
jgi:hypothetical protein